VPGWLFRWVSRQLHFLSHHAVDLMFVCVLTHLTKKVNQCDEQYACMCLRLHFRFAEKYLHVLAELLLMYSECDTFPTSCASRSECITLFLTCVVLRTLCFQEHKTPSLCIKAFMCACNKLSPSRYNLVCASKILLFL
jgi:hypothetical protein